MAWIQTSVALPPVGALCEIGLQHFPNNTIQLFPALNAEKDGKISVTALEMYALTIYSHDNDQLPVNARASVLTKLYGSGQLMRGTVVIVSGFGDLAVSNVLCILSEEVAARRAHNLAAAAKIKERI